LPLVGKHPDPDRTRSPPSLLDDLERKLACAQRGHNESPPLVRRVGLVMAPSAERDQLIQVEVGAALGALDHVVDVQAAAAAAGLAAPAGSRQDDVPDGLPLFWRGRRPAARSRLVRLPPRPRRSAERLTPDHQPSSRHGLPTWANTLRSRQRCLPTWATPPWHPEPSPAALSGSPVIARQRAPPSRPGTRGSRPERSPPGRANAAEPQPALQPAACPAARATQRAGPLVD